MIADTNGVTPDDERHSLGQNFLEAEQRLEVSAESMPRADLIKWIQRTNEAGKKSQQMD